MSGGDLGLFSSWINEESYLIYRMVCIDSQQKRRSSGEALLQLPVIQSSCALIFFLHICYYVIFYLNLKFE